MKKTKIDKVIDLIREDVPTNHTGDGVSNYDPVMSHMERKKKSPVSNWIKSAIASGKKK